MTRGYIIAIDGPAASGKGTIVQLLTDFLHGVNIYTGGLYRALALQCLRENVSFEDEQDVIDVLNRSVIGLGEELGVVATIYLNGEDVTQKIRNPDVAIGAGKVVLIPQIRKEMVMRQQKLVKGLVEQGKIVILDGQDAGTFICPDAEMKIFLTASQETRAQRRQKQYSKEGLEKNFTEMVEEIHERDKRDFERALHPLSSDPIKDGYFVVDSTSLNEHQTLDVIINELKNRSLV